MASTVTLPIWPSSYDCLSWSKDNCIAVGGGDQIAILTPRLAERGTDGTYWDSTIFKANAFTADEIPLSGPLSFANFSPGEEQSLRHVQALAWSYPGLSRHGGCVLAILSSNHVLSIWKCEGKPNVSANWKRKIIVNHEIRKYYDGRQTKDKETEEEARERKQVWQRVRAFAWSPPVYKEWSGHDEILTPFADWGHQFLAVSTEAEDVLLFRVQSAHEPLDPDATGLKVEVSGSFNTGFAATDGLATTFPDEEYDRLSCKDDMFIADHLAWGKWRWEDGGFGDHAPLAFISNGRLFCVKVEGSAYNKLPGAKLVDRFMCRHFVSSRSDITGPLKFVPKTDLLIAFAVDRVLCVETSADPASADESTFTHHHLDDRWDEVTGVACSAIDEELPRLHITSHLSTSTAPTSSLTLPFKREESSRTPPWQAQINASKAAFSKQWKLDGHVQERTWGIAVSPLGDYLATAITMVPSDSISYVSASDQRTVINITHEVKVSADAILPINGGCANPSDVTSETLLFGLQRYLERAPGVAGDTEALVKALIAAAKFPEGEHSLMEEDAISSGCFEPVQVLRYLRLRMFWLPEVIESRSRLLVDMALKRVQNANNLAQPVIRRLVSEVLRLPNDIDRSGPLSSSIHRIYEILQAKLEPQRHSGDASSEASSWKEDCRICQKDIPFESINWARCDNGHRFSRCSLTFLAIQEPGATKSCAICGAKVLNEWLLPGVAAVSHEEDLEMTDLPDELPEIVAEREEEQAGQLTTDIGWVEVSRKDTLTSEPASSLARILFAAFDRCIYCGGKFVA